MDPSSSFVVIEESRYYFLAEDATGFSLWSVVGDNTDDPVLVFSRDDEGLRLGLSICYDLRFPELYRGLMTSGAAMLAVPSAFQAVTGAAHWETLLRARAIEEQSYVLAAAQWGPWGSPEAGHRTYGNAMIVDPWGEIVVRAPDEGDGVWFAEVDADAVRAVRTRLPALSHRRLVNAC